MSILTTPLSWIERAVLFHFPSESHKNFKSKFHKVLDKHRWNLYWIKKCTLMNCLRDVKLKLSVDFLCLPKSSSLVRFFFGLCVSSLKTHTYEVWVETVSTLNSFHMFNFVWKRRFHVSLSKRKEASVEEVVEKDVKIASTLSGNGEKLAIELIENWIFNEQNYFLPHSFSPSPRNHSIP